MTREEAVALYSLVAFGKDEGAFVQLSVAAVDGDVEAQCQIGLLSRDAAHNFGKAFEWLEKAARQGHAEAQYNLGGLYATGQGVAENLGEAAKWLEKSANQGFADAMPILATAYLEGLGVTQNREKAREWATKGAAAGNKTAAQILRDEF